MRVGHSAELVALGQAYFSITSLVSENMESQEEELGRWYPVLTFTKKWYWIKGLKSRNDCKNNL